MMIIASDAQAHEVTVRLVSISWIALMAMVGIAWIACYYRSKDGKP